MSIRVRSSILMTSAPKSPSRRVATEPTPIQQKSATRMPAIGPVRGLTVRSGVAGAAGIPHDDKSDLGESQERDGCRSGRAGHPLERPDVVEADGLTRPRGRLDTYGDQPVASPAPLYRFLKTFRRGE